MLCEKTTEVIKKCFEELILHKVNLGGIILKPNMILAGNKSKDKISSEEVAKLTLECLKNSVPSEVPGIAFLIWRSIRDRGNRKFKSDK